MRSALPLALFLSAVVVSWLAWLEVSDFVSDRSTSRRPLQVDACGLLRALGEGVALCGGLALRFRHLLRVLPLLLCLVLLLAGHRGERDELHLLRREAAALFALFGFARWQWWRQERLVPIVALPIAFLDLLILRFSGRIDGLGVSSQERGLLAYVNAVLRGER